MKTRTLLLLALVPGLVGYVVNLIVLLPIIGSAAFSLQGLAVGAFCVWLGTQCAKSSRRFFSALLLSQWPSIVSLFLYVWQFHFCGDETRNFFLAMCSQMPCEPLFFFAAKVVMPFSNHSWGPPESLAATIISLTLLVLLFSGGFWWEKRRTAKAAPQS